MSKKRPQKTIHMIFKEISELESDPGWKTKFIEASQGKFPPGFVCRRGVLTFTKSKKTHKLEIVDNHEVLRNNFKTFLRDHTQYKSRLDNREDSKRNEEKINNNKSIEDYEWKDIRRKGVKGALITNFVNRTAEALQLNDNEKYDLTLTINIGMSNGTIIPTTCIHFHDGEIKSIDNILYNEETRTFSLCQNAKKRRDRNQNPPRDFDLLDNVTTGTQRYTFDKAWKIYIDDHINKSETIHDYGGDYCSTSYEAHSMSIDVTGD